MNEAIERINIFQNELHRHLNLFLNSESLSRGLCNLFYPEYHSASFSDFLRLIESDELCSSCNLSDGLLSQIKQLNGKIVSTCDYAQILAGLSSGFYSCLTQYTRSDISEVVNVDFPKEYSVWQDSITDKHYIAPLIIIKSLLQEKAKNYLSAALLHGSLATLDYVKGFSDVDMLLVLRKGVIFEADKLSSLRKLLMHIRILFYLIDPLQHHGFMIITEEEQGHYPQTYFPLELFKYSCTFIKDSSVLSFMLRDCAKERRKHFLDFCLAIEGQDSNICLHDLFNWKFFLHQVLLLPTIYLQAKGQYCYKKDSFPISRGDFDFKEWQIIDEVSNIRLNWNYRASLPSVLRNILAKMRYPFYIPKLETRIGRICNQDTKTIPRLFSLARQLTHSMRQKFVEAESL